MDEFSEQNVRLLDVLARALHIKDARLEPALQAIVSPPDVIGQAKGELATVARRLAETGELLP
jgi:hypothetical protein